MKLTDRFSAIKFGSFLLIILCAGVIFVIISSESKKENVIISSESKKEDVIISSESKKENYNRKIIVKEQVGKKKSFNASKKKELKDNNVESLNTSVKAVGDEKKKVFREKLGKLAREHDPSLIDFVKKALDDPDPEVGRDAIELLEDYEFPEKLPAIEQALNSQDEETRINAVDALDEVNDPMASDLLIQALNDPSEEVRASALDLGEEYYDSDMWLSVMEAGISSQYDDVKYKIVSLLEDRDDKSALDIIILGLKDDDPKFHAEVNEVLDFMIDKKFDTYEAAFIYWTNNKDSYDDDL